MTGTPPNPAEMHSVGWLRKFADNLEQAPREGAAEDVPEGSRTVRLSDTLAKELVEYLRIFLVEKRRADLSGVMSTHQVAAGTTRFIQAEKPTPPANHKTRDGDPTPK